MTEAPSGHQVELRHGRSRIVLVEVSGGIREYEVDGQPVIDGYALDRMADGGRGQPLLPWPNRLADGLYEFDGNQLQLPIEEAARHNAIHGLTRWLNWRIAEQANDRARLELVLRPRPGYPFTLALALEYVLSDEGLRVRTVARNAGASALPFGAGQHPYLTVGTPTIDTATLLIPAATRIELDAERRLPTGRKLDVAGSPLDFRTARAIGDTLLDECYTDLERDTRGVARATLSDPRTQRSVTLWMDRHYRYLQVFSGDTLAPARRRQGLALEPMTCPPNAFRTATDLIVLQPGEEVALEWGLAVT